jgi:hypothetical protein
VQRKAGDISCLLWAFCQTSCDGVELNRILSIAAAIAAFCEQAILAAIFRFGDHKLA